MTFENNTAPKRADAEQQNWAAENGLLSTTDSAAASKPLVERTGWEDLFGSPVVDSRLGTQPTGSLFGPQDANVDVCDLHKKGTTQKESLDYADEGNSILNRMYEVAVLTPKGKVEPPDFVKTYGEQAAQKMQELGITGVIRQGDNIWVNLAKPLHFGDSSGSIDISKQVSFTAHPSAGMVTLDRVGGVTASNGVFQLPINRVDLQPRKDGYLSGSVSASWSQTQVCAFPDGKIYK